MSLDQKEVDRSAKQQQAYWNGDMGTNWVRFESVLDEMLAPFTEILLQQLSEPKPNNVLDIGCGFGSLTVAVYDYLNGGEEQPISGCIGLDISAPMVELARANSTISNQNLNYICADGAVYDFGQTKFDFIVSRFGVMFFADPVIAFANLYKAANTNARLAFIAWRGPQENDFMTVAPRILADYVESTPPPVGYQPGPFSFADNVWTSEQLAKAGWSKITFQALDVPCRFNADSLHAYTNEMMRLGPDFEKLSKTVQSEVLAKIHDAHLAMVQDDALRFTARVWLVTACKQSA
ncbi:MAG: class I SAM-dependent methyltransferase [Pseudomonadota bacterium]